MASACSIDVQHRINRGTLLVISVNAIKILLDQIVARQSTCFNRFVNVSDGSFHQMEGAVRRAVSERHEQQSKDNCYFFWAHEF